GRAATARRRSARRRRGCSGCRARWRWRWAPGWHERGTPPETPAVRAIAQARDSRSRRNGTVRALASAMKTLAALLIALLFSQVVAAAAARADGPGAPAATPSAAPPPAPEASAGELAKPLPEPKPFYRRWWFYSLVSVGGLAVGAGIAYGVARRGSSSTV